MHKNVPHQKLYQMPITWKFTLIAKLTRGQFLPMNIEHKLRRPICGILWDDVFFDWQNRPGKWINTMALSDCLIKAKNVWHLELSAKARVIPLDKLSALLTTTSASLWPPHGLQLCDPENKSWQHWFAFAFRETKHFLKSTTRIRYSVLVLVMFLTDGGLEPAKRTISAFFHRFF